MTGLGAAWVTVKGTQKNDAFRMEKNAVPNPNIWRHMYNWVKLNL